jgi:16S rRNA (cytosine1402-N4)-methyltransferase
MTNAHVPVLLRQAVALLNATAGGTFLDCTLGGAGHSTAILEAAPQNRLFALDADPAAIPRAAALAERFGDRFHFTSANFAELDTTPGAPFTGILADLGVSSFQLDDATRGFSFREDAPADMRMNPLTGISAAEFLETAGEDELVEAIRDFGEEPRWRNVVRAILAARGTGKLSRTASLAALIADAVYRPGPPARLHPATLSFQGLRIAVNAELSALRTMLPKAFDALAPAGIAVIISFHSLEDRIVKRFFNELAGRPVDRRDSRPQDERTASAELLTRHPVVPDAEEAAGNPRARSAKLRAIRKLSSTPVNNSTVNNSTVSHS